MSVFLQYDEEYQKCFQKHIVGVHKFVEYPKVCSVEFFLNKILENSQ